MKSIIAKSVLVGIVSVTSVAANAGVNPLAVPEHSGVYTCPGEDGETVYQLDVAASTLLVKTIHGRLALAGTFYVARNEVSKAVTYALAGTGAALVVTSRGVTGSGSFACTKAPTE